MKLYAPACRIPRGHGSMSFALGAVKGGNGSATTKPIVVLLVAVALCLPHPAEGQRLLDEGAMLHKTVRSPRTQSAAHCHPSYKQSLLERSLPELSEPFPDIAASVK